MKLYSTRAGIVFILVALLFVGVELRLFYVQVIRGEHFAGEVEKQTKRRVVISPLRGMILDRDGKVLARAVHRKAEVIVEEDSTVLKLNRLYPYGKTGAQLLGFTGQDGEGLAGVEFSSDSLLKGEAGWTVKQLDGRRRRFGRVGLPGKPVEDGADVHLTIDVEVQKIVERALEKAVKDNEAKNAMGIVMDPHTGEVIAMASSPTYNANYWWKSKSEARRNRVVGFNYEPGSTMKVMTLASALNENLFKPEDSIDGNKGRYEIYNEVIRDHASYDMLSLEDALSYSSNVAFAKIADSLGQERMYRYTRDYGFGSPTNITLSGEEKGLLHPLEKWSGRTGVTIAFGHEINATLLQVATAFCTIANGGLLLKPQIIKEVTGENGEVLQKCDKEVIRSVIRPEVAAQVRKMMEGVVKYGTARKVKLDVVPMAGKTGTSEKIDKETGRYSKEKVWASFVGMAPVENPVVVVAVVVDEPAGAAAGGKAAAPAVAEIIRKIVATPNLSIGQDIMLARNGETRVKPTKVVKYPELGGMTRREAVRICKANKVPFEFVGDGELIMHQSPDAGVEVIDDAPVLLYTDRVISNGEEEKIAVMPSCVGRTMKDAINALSIKGLTPSFVGYGRVIGQKPTAGTVVTLSEPCSLFCDTREEF